MRNGYRMPYNLIGEPTWAAGGDHSRTIDQTDAEIIRLIFHRLGASHQDKERYLELATGSRLATIDTLSVAAGRIIADQLRKLELNFSVERIIREKLQNGDQPLD